MSDEDDRPSVFQRVKRSFRGKKGKRRPNIRVDEYPPVNLKYPPNHIKAEIDKVSKTLKTLAKSLKKGKNCIDCHLYAELRNGINDITQCFQEQNSTTNKYTEDDDGGFSQKSSNDPSQKSSVTVHNTLTDPLADYPLNSRKRNEQGYRASTEREHVPQFTVISPERQQEQTNAYGTNHQGNDRARGRSRGDQMASKRAHSVDERKPRFKESKLQEELKVREELNESLQKKIKTLERDLQAEIKARESAQNGLQAETKARESAQNRLSEMMGKQLKTNNPAITDLSDPDRPLTLVDKFSNVYDNDWTDIMEDIETVLRDERMSIKILLSIVTDTYNECYALRHKGKFFMGFENRSALVKYTAAKVPDDCNYILKSIPSDHLKDLRDAILKNLANDVDRHVLSCLTESNKKYLTKCLEICWMMVCHTPPIHLEWNYKGQPFDLTLLKPYTEAGDIVEYVVWPVVFLHKDGPILSKGVAQGKIRNVQHTQF